MAVEDGQGPRNPDAHVDGEDEGGTDRAWCERLVTQGGAQVVDEVVALTEHVDAVLLELVQHVDREREADEAGSRHRAGATFGRGPTSKTPKPASPPASAKKGQSKRATCARLEFISATPNPPGTAPATEARRGLTYSVTGMSWQPNGVQ